MSHEDYYDSDRYDSAANWEPKRPNYDAIRRRLERERIKNDPGLTPFETLSGAAVSRPQPGTKPPTQLFGSLWHEGEVALLAGPSSSGKSVLAVQIADQIARAKNRRPVRTASDSDRVLRPRPALQASGDPNPFRTTAPPQKVLYVDFAQTAAQFAERYTVPNPIPGKLPLRHRFPNNFIRADLSALEEIPDRFRNYPHRYFQYWLLELIEDTQARVLILDNLTYLTRSLTSYPSAAATAKNLKLWSQRCQISILATVNTRPSSCSPPGLRRGADASSAGWSGRRGSSLSLRPSTLADIAASAPLTDLADTVFTISPSLLGPDLRYIKHLKCRREVDEYDASTVIVCQLQRQTITTPSRKKRGHPPLLRQGGEKEEIPSSKEGWQSDAFCPTDGVVNYSNHEIVHIPQNPHSAGSPPVLGGVDAALGGRGGPHSISPFLGLMFLGLSPESIHLTDPFTPIRRPNALSIRNAKSKIPIEDDHRRNAPLTGILEVFGTLIEQFTSFPLFESPSELFKRYNSSPIMKVVFNSDMLYATSLIRDELPRKVRDFVLQCRDGGHEIIIPETTLFEFQNKQSEFRERELRSLRAAAALLDSYRIHVDEFNPGTHVPECDLLKLLDNLGAPSTIESPTMEDFQSAHKRACFHAPPGSPEAKHDEMRDLVIWAIALRIAREEGGALLLSGDSIHRHYRGDIEASEAGLVRIDSFERAMEHFGLETRSGKVAKAILTTVWAKILRSDLRLKDGAVLISIKKPFFVNLENGTTRLKAIFEFGNGAGKLVNTVGTIDFFDENPLTMVFESIVVKGPGDEEEKIPEPVLTSSLKTVPI